MKVQELPKNAILKYYREKDQIRGVVLALDHTVLGWSLCNKRDKFDKELAIKIAYERAKSIQKEDYGVVYNKIPRTIQPLFNEIYERSKKYYK